jgi:hypothetical protein
MAGVTAASNILAYLSKGWNRRYKLCSRLFEPRAAADERDGAPVSCASLHFFGRCFESQFVNEFSAGQTSRAEPVDHDHEVKTRSKLSF